MMKRRTVNTHIWEDTFFEDLAPQEKLLFLYLITSPIANILGIYEISIKRISFDTDITKDKVRDIIKKFEKQGKVYYKQNYIILPNFLKNQSMNSNMWKGAVEIFNGLPNELKTWIEKNLSESFESLLKASESFERVGESFEKEEGESERENEGEGENEKKTPGPHTFQNSKCADPQYVKENIGQKYQKYDLDYYYETTMNWALSKGVKRKDWLAQIRGIIQKDEREGKAKYNKAQQGAPL